MYDTLVASDIALNAIQRYSSSGNPSAYFAFSEGNSYFRMPDVPGLIVYRPTGRYLVQFGGPFAPEEVRRTLLRGFVEFAAEQGRQIVAVQVQHADAPPYLEEGFTVNQMGASYAVDLDTFSLYGTKFMQLRNKISRALRTGLEISEASYDDWRDAIKGLDRLWLRTKGEGVKELEFLVGQLGGRHQSERRLFVATQNDKLIGYVSYSPVFGPQPGWMHDLSRRQPDSPPGVMEAINKAAIDVFRAEGVPWLHFGFINHLGEHGEHIYPARTQLAYKEKWAPTLVLPEYIAFQRGASLPALVHIFRACNAI
jgi:lysylphosphatidylglycerol synthetase-like protein (DUF2156 family)